MMKFFGLFAVILCVFCISPAEAQDEQNRSTYNAPSAPSSAAAVSNSRPVYSATRSGASSGARYSASTGPLYLNRNTYSQNTVAYSTSRQSSSTALSQSRESLLARRAQMEADYQRRLDQGDTAFQQRRAARQAQIDESNAILFGQNNEEEQGSSYNLELPDGVSSGAKKKKRSVYRRNTGLQSPERVFNSVR